MATVIMFSWGVETLRIDGYLTLTLLTQGSVAVFHRLMKYLERMLELIQALQMCCRIENASGRVPLDTNRHLTGEEANPKTKEQVKEVNGAASSSSQRTGRSGDLHL